MPGHRQQHQGVDADAGNILDFLLDRSQPYRLFFRAQHGKRMGCESDNDRFAARFRRLVDSRAHDLLMAQMHAVKGPQRDDGALAIRYFLKGME